jgi:hypothetical protein
LCPSICPGHHFLQTGVGDYQLLERPVALEDKLDSLAAKVVEGAFKIAIPTAADRIDGLRTIADAIGGSARRRRARDTLFRRLEDAKDEIADRLARAVPTEFPGLTQTDREIAIDGVMEALSGIAVRQNNFISKALSAKALFALAVPVATTAWKKAELPDVAQYYGRLYLHQSCDYLVGVALSLPGMSERIAWENYILTHKIEAALETGIRSVAMPSVGVPSVGAREDDLESVRVLETARVETGYLSDVAITYQHVELFGIDLPGDLRRQPIQEAYVTLSASKPTVSALPRRNDAASRTREPAEQSVDVDVSIAKVISSQVRRSAGRSVDAGRGARIRGRSLFGSIRLTVEDSEACGRSGGSPHSQICEG